MPKLPRAWLSRTIPDFLSESPASLLGELTKRSQFDIDLGQRSAWTAQIQILQEQLANLSGEVHFELGIPRLGKRIDVLLLVHDKVIVLEFKVGSETGEASARRQAWDYALDLKSFHEGSHEAEIVPVLVPTGVRLDQGQMALTGPDEDGVWPPVTLAPSMIRDLIDELGNRKIFGKPLATDWIDSNYKPTPTIVEAARRLYARHSVHDILHSGAGEQNLDLTVAKIEEVISHARANGRKAICFVTGVPGAGKTLVGLQTATRHERQEDQAHAVYLSGNGPLVRVLVEALARDEVKRVRDAGERVLKKDAVRKVSSFIQSMHHFRDEALKSDSPPDDHVVIFDEAQRAWTRDKAADFMKRKRGLVDFAQSEPEFLISYLDRHRDWAVIVCLVGGGQEIHTGEGGIGEWFAALRDRFVDWEIHVSDQITDREYEAGGALNSLPVESRLNPEFRLHLGTSIRSFRAENVSSFVKLLLDGDSIQARDEADLFSLRYPIVTTRSLTAAKNWIRRRARGTERVGLVASSKAQRLKPHSIDIRVDVDPIHYFLNPAEDTRSSFYLEDAATEFQIQGLELDWVLVSWDGDLRRQSDRWAYHHFKGSRWTRVLKEENRSYLLNAYRVLLTRARQGMAIFVPTGDPQDPTRDPRFYDETFEHLRACGVPVLDER